MPPGNSRSSTVFRAIRQPCEPAYRSRAAKDLRIVKALSASAEERYLDFMRSFPTIAQRVPQWMVASYLGLSPETVSRIRSHLQRK